MSTDNINRIEHLPSLYVLNPSKKADRKKDRERSKNKRSKGRGKMKEKSLIDEHSVDRRA